MPADVMRNRCQRIRIRPSGYCHCLLLLTFKAHIETIHLDGILEAATGDFYAKTALQDGHANKHASHGKQHRIPVCYDLSVAPDLETLAQHAQLEISSVIKHHTNRRYHVYATGFLPGFAFLGFVDPAIATPRLATPRQTLAPGSVGIADRQTGIYPYSSPAGWHIIGRTPENLQPQLQPRTAAIDQLNANGFVTPSFNWQPKLRLGDWVQFYEISLAEFEAALQPTDTVGPR